MKSPKPSSGNTIRRIRPAGPCRFFCALIEGIKIAALAVLVYLFALPFVLLAGLGIIILFLANAYLLGREYFELAAMRFRPPHEAKSMRKANAAYVFLAGMVVAAFRVDPDRQLGHARLCDGLHGPRAQKAGRRQNRTRRSTALTVSLSDANR